MNITTSSSMSTSTTTTTTTAEKHYLFTKVLEIETFEPSPGGEDRRLVTSMHRSKQIRCWYDHPTDFTSETFAAAQGGISVPLSYRDDHHSIDSLKEELSKMGVVPEREYLNILAKIYEVLLEPVQGNILVLIAEVTVRLLGSFDDHHFIDNSVRTSPNFDFPIEFRDGDATEMRLETYTVGEVDYHRTRGLITDGLTLEIDSLTLESFETQWVRFVPATRSAIESLQKVRLDSLEEATLERNPSCSICNDDFADPQGGGDQLVIPLPCAHHYHVDCIIHWLETSHLCPLCRYALPTVEEGEPSNS